MRMLKLVGHKDVTLQEYEGYHHGNIHVAGTVPMATWVKQILARHEQDQDKR